MKKVALVLMLLMSIVGCTKVIVKDSNQNEERQKAAAWIKSNNVWGAERTSTNIVGIVGKYIDQAILVGSDKSSAATAGSNIYIAINNKAMKSGKDMMIIWKDNTFSVREMPEEEATEMKIPDYGLKKGDL